MSDGSSGSPSNGFSVRVYTPTTWISKQAADAARQYKDFGREDVDDKMLLPLLRVFVNPDMPREVSKRGMSGTLSVDHVVIRDEERKKVIQPEYKEEFSDEAQNAFGAQRIRQVDRRVQELRKSKMVNFSSLSLARRGKRRISKSKRNILNVFPNFSRHSYVETTLSIIMISV